MTTEKKRAPWINWALFFGTMIIVFLLGLLASSVTERRAEREYVFKPRVELSEFEPRNVIWGKNYPREYETYRQTAHGNFRSKHNGSVKIDELELDPRLVVIWAGYAFSKDYYQGRGHYSAIADIRNTLRTGTPKGPDDGPQPATCWTCKSPDVPRLMEKMGPTEFYRGQWAAKGPEIMNYIGCADCHDPKTMDLRITRPALVEAFKAMGKDISRASHQAMRSLVCAQCHAEYFFDKQRPDAPEVAYLTFPWEYGTTADAAFTYYEERNFSDFTHQFSRTPILKAQHPDYELYKTGIHADRGVACADCHMPYVVRGGQKFTNHMITSPLDNISETCQVCHRESEETLRDNVYERQDMVKQIRDRAETELVRAHMEAKTAWDAGAPEKEMEPVLSHIRKAQWFWDYNAASHGASFHSPVEVSRLIGISIDEAKEARILLARILAKHGKNDSVPYPDIATKAKAQQFIGLDMTRLNAEKETWINEVLPVWDQKAKEREEKWKVIEK
jgi:nitrite reductase (cytochrome c-552)